MQASAWRGARCGSRRGRPHVVRVARHVHDLLVLLRVLVHLARLAHDHRRVDVHRPADVALGAVGDEDLVGRDLAVVQRRRDLLAQRALALLRAVARIGILRAEVGHALQQPGEDVVRHGLRGVADAQADDVGVG
eukprot:6348005-Prymnesium_polylepis.1